jgi:hypothetical protein
MAIILIVHVMRRRIAQGQGHGGPFGGNIKLPIARSRSPGFFRMSFSICVELAVITFAAHFKNGFGFSSPGGGWEYPFYWVLMFFAIAMRGGAPWSLDRLIGREL